MGAHVGPLVDAGQRLLLGIYLPVPVCFSLQLLLSKKKEDWQMEYFILLTTKHIVHFQPNTGFVDPFKKTISGKVKVLPHRLLYGIATVLLQWKGWVEGVGEGGGEGEGEGEGEVKGEGEGDVRLTYTSPHLHIATPTYRQTCILPHLALPRPLHLTSHRFAVNRLNVGPRRHA